MPAGDIAEQLQLLQPAASKHLRVLNKAGLVEVEAAANQRIYWLRHRSFQDLDNWIESFKHVWEERFDRLDEYLRKLHDKN